MIRKSIITAITIAAAVGGISGLTATSASAWDGGYGYGQGYGGGYGGYGYHHYVRHCWEQPIYGWDAYGYHRVIVGYRRVCD